MSKYSAIREAALETMRRLGTKGSLMDDAARSIVEKKAAEVGLPDLVYHSSPHAFSSIRGGEDQFIHVAQDPRVAMERLSDIRESIDQPIFNLTPKEAKKLQTTKKDIEKGGGYLYEMYSKLGNPLDVRDFGQFNIQHLLTDQKSIQNLLDEPVKAELQKLVSAQNELYDAFSNARNNPKLKALLAEQIQAIENEQMRVFSTALKEKGYDSLRYRNVIEAPKQYDKTKNELLDITYRLSLLDDTIDDLVKEGADKSIIAGLKNEKLKLRAAYENAEKEMPLSYALFPDTPTRHTAAKFAKNKIATNPNDLLASLGIVSGAGLASSLLDSPEAEAGVISRFSDVAKAMSPLVKKGEISKSDIMKTLGWSARPKSEKEISEINNSALNLLNFAIMDKLGIPLDSRPGLYMDRYIKQFQPWLKGREQDLIQGLYNRQEGLKSAKDRLISEFNYTPEEADKYIKKKYKDTGGFYSPESLKTVRYELPYPNNRDIATADIPTKHRIVLLQPEFGPSLVDHELNHYLNYLQDPVNSRGLNPAYTFKHPTKSENAVKDSFEYLNRLYRISDEENVDKLYRTLRDKKLIDADVFSENFNKPLEGKEREFKDVVFSFVPKDRQLEFNFADHFLDYGHYEPERALEFLNNRISMPRRNPSEGEHILRTMGNNPEETKVNAELFERLKNDMQKIEVPIENIDSMKQIYNNPTYVKPKFLSNKEKARLQELEKKFGNIDSDDFGDL